MNTIANAVIDFLGGTTALAKVIESPVSTVHSWRTIGIPASRLAHIRLAAQVRGTPLPESLGDLVSGDIDSHEASNIAPVAISSTGQSDELSGQVQA